MISSLVSSSEQRKYEGFPILLMECWLLPDLDEALVLEYTTERFYPIGGLVF